MKLFKDIGLFTFEQSNERIRKAIIKYSLQENVLNGLFFLWT